MQGIDFIEKIENTGRYLKEKNVLIFWHILLPSFFLDIKKIGIPVKMWLYSTFYFDILSTVPY